MPAASTLARLAAQRQQAQLAAVLRLAAVWLAAVQQALRAVARPVEAQQVLRPQARPGAAAAERWPPAVERPEAAQQDAALPEEVQQGQPRPEAVQALGSVEASTARQPVAEA